MTFLLNICYVSILLWGPYREARVEPFISGAYPLAIRLSVWLFVLMGLLYPFEVEI
jgi:hypothetical protein